MINLEPRQRKTFVRRRVGLLRETRDNERACRPRGFEVAVS
jgi:hypothetical protein